MKQERLMIIEEEGRFFLIGKNNEIVTEAVTFSEDTPEEEIRADGYVPMTEVYPNTSTIHVFLDREEFWVKKETA